jgi:hypothetical protein
MSRIRAFEQRDVEPVARLHHRVFGGPGADQKFTPELLERYAAWFERTFFRNPWFDEALVSQVCEEADGAISGFLGVLPRRMSFRGTAIRVAMSSQFVVDPSRRATGAGVRLLKTFLAGPQDLSVTDEANNVSRQLWEGLGGRTAFLHCLHWTCYLRPMQYCVSRLRSLGTVGLLALPATPFGLLADRLLSGVKPARFRPSPPDVIAEDLDPETLLRCLQESARARSLWPDYDGRSLQWVREMITYNQQPHPLRQVLVRNSRREIVGWYLYVLKRGDVSTVVQLVAHGNAIHDVLGHLLQDAWQRGSLAVSGRLEPRTMQAVADRHGLCTCGTPWMLIHARDPELLRAFSEGDVLFSSLEGEMCIRFK